MRIIFILLLFIIILSQAQAQVRKFIPETIVKYTFRCKPYLNEETIFTFEMSLLSKGNLSFFMENKMINLDRQMNSFVNSSKSFEEMQKQLIKLPKPDIRSVIRKDLKSKLLESNQLIATNYYYFDVPLNIKWDIMKEKQKLLGYDVQKATCAYKGRDYIAWFTTQIPLADGPYVFSGLPGLILKIHDTKMDYSYEATDIQKGVPQDEVYFHLFSKPIRTTQSEFEALKKVASANVLASIESNPNIIMNEENKRKILENANRINGKKLNPMELED